MTTREIDLGTGPQDGVDTTLLARCIGKGIIDQSGAVWLILKGWRNV